MCHLKYQFEGGWKDFLGFCGGILRKKKKRKLKKTNNTYKIRTLDSGYHSPTFNESTNKDLELANHHAKTSFTYKQFLIIFH